MRGRSARLAERSDTRKPIATPLAARPTPPTIHAHVGTPFLGSGGASPGEGGPAGPSRPATGASAAAFGSFTSVTSTVAVCASTSVTLRVSVL